MKATRANGFTLIEVIVTLTVVSLLFTIILISFNRNNSRASLALQTETLVSDIRSAALKALASEQFQNQAPGGWGVYFDGTSSTYTVFADLDSDRAYDLNEKYSSIVLTNNVGMDNGVYYGGVFHSTSSLVFNQVDGAPYIDTNAIGVDDILIPLHDQVNDAGTEVSVNLLGIVDSATVE